MPEFIAANRGNTASDACVIFDAADIRESVAPAEERIFPPPEVAASEVAVADAPAAEVVTIREADEIDLRYTESPPRCEEVTGAAR